jgi:hypothetical protein
MRRPAKGGTTHPTQVRPGMGYGRPLRPRPGPITRTELLAEIAVYLRAARLDDVDGVRDGQKPAAGADVRA